MNLEFGNFKAKEVDNIWTKTGSLTLTFDHVTWKSIGNIYSLRASNVQTMWQLSSKKVMILSRQHLYKDQTFDLSLQHVTWKSLGNINTLGASNVPSLAGFKQKGRKLLSRQTWSTDDW